MLCTNALSPTTIRQENCLPSVRDSGFSLPSARGSVFSDGSDVDGDPHATVASTRVLIKAIAEFDVDTSTAVEVDSSSCAPTSGSSTAANAALPRDEYVELAEVGAGVTNMRPSAAAPAPLSVSQATRYSGVNM